MNEPEVFILMLRVDDWGTQVVRSVMGDLRVSFQLIELNPPPRSHMPTDSPEGVSLREQIEHYLKVCRRVLFLVGDTGKFAPPDVFLKRIVSLVEERERGRGGVSRLKLRDRLLRAPGPEPPGQATIRYGDEPALTKFLKQSILGPVMGGASKAPRPTGAPPADDRRRGLDFSKDVLDRPRVEGDEINGSLLDEIGSAKKELGRKAPRDRTAFADDIPAAPDEVICSVYSPRLAAPGDEILVQAFAHLQEQEEAVSAMSAAADPKAAKVGARRLSEQVAEGERLGFHLTLRGSEIDVPDQEFVWEREPLAAQFSVYFPETSQPRDAVGTVLVTKGGVPVGHVKFTLRVVTREQKEAAASDAPEQMGEYSRYHTAFVSYASKDRERVVPRVQALAAARIKVFQDFIELEPGERWERGLYKHIDECDVFFLFWSQAAKDSKWVCEETKYAHARHGENDERPPEIIPIIIEGPPPPKPPPELNFLHFNDKYIYLLKGVEAEAEARRKEQP